jgi:hypothetical protein
MLLVAVAQRCGWISLPLDRGTNAFFGGGVKNEIEQKNA